MKSLFAKDGPFDELMEQFDRVVDTALHPEKSKIVRIRLTSAQIGLLLTGEGLTVRMPDGLTIQLEKKI